MDVPRGLVVLDSYLDLHRDGQAGLAHEYAQIAGDRGTLKLQLAMRLARSGSESVGETLGRYLMWRCNIPEPVLQYEVRDERGAVIARLDWAWPEYGAWAEFDGLKKYTNLLRRGEEPADAVIREKLREDRVREITGWRVVRLTWADLQQPHATAARLQRLLQIGAR